MHDGGAPQAFFLLGFGGFEVLELRTVVTLQEEESPKKKYALYTAARFFFLVGGKNNSEWI